MAYTSLYVNNTRSDVSMFHNVIAEAVRNGGQFDCDYSDIFLLVKNTTDSGAEYALYFA